MSNHRQSVREYIRACEVLLRITDLNVSEQAATDEMMLQLQKTLRLGNDPES